MIMMLELLFHFLAGQRTFLLQKQPSTGFPFTFRRLVNQKPPVKFNRFRRTYIREIWLTTQFLEIETAKENRRKAHFSSLLNLHSRVSELSKLLSII